MAIMVAMALQAAPVAPVPEPQRVGIVADPCAVLPPPPRMLVEYMAQVAKAKAAKTAPPAPTAEGMAIYTQWQQQVLAADFPGLCRYRKANATLSPATPRRVVFFGDSITEFWSQRQPGFFAGDRVNRGISGQTTTQMVGRFRADVIDLHPRIVHIMAGTNDIAGNTGPTTLDAIVANVETMVDLAQAHGIRVVIGSVLPARRFDWRPGVDPVAAIRDLNAALRALAGRRKLTFVDYYAALDDGQHGLSPANAQDGVHPTAAGYAIMQPLTERALATAR